MTRQKMFLRMITASLVRRRSRMLVALLAIAVGATILSGLVTIYYDVPRQMGAQFRGYGANMIFLAADNDAVFDRAAVEAGAALIDGAELVGVAPYRYETVRIHEQPIVAAGTDLAGVQTVSPYWLVNGAWPAESGEVLMGREVANLLGLKEGDSMDVIYTTESEGETAPDADTASNEVTRSMTVSGILETGGSEENYIYMSMEDLEALAGPTTRLDVAELSISATQEKLTSYADAIEAQNPDISAQLVKRITQSESTVLTKLQALVLLVTVVVLVLTMICVATTMTAVVTERRKEIGLRKALGASDGGIVGECMGEGLLLGAVGGLIGAGLGFGFAQLISVHVFSSSISFRPLLLVITVVVSVAVTGLACLLPVRSATEVDPALVLKGE